MNLKFSPKLWRYFALSGAVAAGCAVLLAIWSWSTEPPLVVPGLLGAPTNTSKALFRSDAEKRTPTAFSNPGDSAVRGPNDSWVSDDVAWWWPEHVGNAANAFFCTPPASQDPQQSVMVWTDTRNHVVAYGAALQGGELPPYASALANAGAPDPRRIVYAAAQGFHVVASGKNRTLGIGDTKLNCGPTSND